MADYYVPGRMRRRVLARDGHRCVCCGARQPLTMDHVIPRVDGGPSTLENLATLCRPCNLSKGRGRACGIVHPAEPVPARRSSVGPGVVLVQWPPVQPGEISHRSVL